MEGSHGPVVPPTFCGTRQEPLSPPMDLGALVMCSSSPDIPCKLLRALRLLLGTARRPPETSAQPRGATGRPCILRPAQGRSPNPEVQALVIRRYEPPVQPEHEVQARIPPRSCTSPLLQALEPRHRVHNKRHLIGLTDFRVPPIRQRYSPRHGFPGQAVAALPVYARKVITQAPVGNGNCEFILECFSLRHAPQSRPIGREVVNECELDNR